MVNFHIFCFSFNRSLYIDTETVKGIEVTMRSGLTWPSLTPDRPIRFPLTHVGNTSHKILTIDNPADVPVVVQVVPLSVYPDAQSVIDVLSDRYALYATNLQRTRGQKSNEMKTMLNFCLWTIIRRNV